MVLYNFTMHCVEHESNRHAGYTSDRKLVQSLAVAGVGKGAPGTPLTNLWIFLLPKRNKRIFILFFSFFRLRLIFNQDLYLFTRQHFL